MEKVEDIVIVGGGIAGLTASLGLHKLGIRSLVLESWHSLRITGFAFSAWTNAWRALDAIGLGDSLRQQHRQFLWNVATSTITGDQTTAMSFKAKGKLGDHELRCVNRKLLLEALANELPSGTIRFSSKVVSIEESSFYKLVHLADGTIIKTKALIGCDGVNSVVAKWLGFKAPAFTRRAAIRGWINFKSNHGFEPKLLQFMGIGFRSGFLPNDDTSIYWFFTSNEKDMEDDPAKLKQFALSKLANVPGEIKAIVENTELEYIMLSPLRYRHPWDLIWGNISKGNVCVLGDAFHPMTPDIGQGACSALEDGIVLARCLAGALLTKEQSGESTEKVDSESEQYKKIEMGLKNYAKERRWRSIVLISTAYVVGFFQQGDGKLTTFLRDKLLAAFLSSLLLKRADYDCGKLNIS
ncbi:monooxygenase 2-like isoform X2 [Quercus lobata]|uniref:FAD-binding domain-containing protein n=1 Tax=Quercus lobata TaxID=97700 RepID=A0A7N2RDV7_QUELO|nr:monooxygenase 2-like isoform X2 [Quercus lobata]